MLKLKLRYFRHLIQRTDSLEKTPMLGKIEGRRRRGCRGWDGWMASPTQWMWVWVNSESWWWTGRPGVLQSMGSQRVKRDWATELFLNPSVQKWEINIILLSSLCSFFGVHILRFDEYHEATYQAVINHSSIIFNWRTSLVVFKTLCFQCRDWELIPGWGTKFPLAVWWRNLF